MVSGDWVHRKVIGYRKVILVWLVVMGGGIGGGETGGEGQGGEE